MQTRSRALLFALVPISLCLLLSACASEPTGSGGEQVSYDADSWKTLIADDCRAYFDGCNNCRRGEESGAACTRKACATYQKPRCLDDPITEGSAGKTPFQGRLLKFSCDGDNRFRVYYGEYVSGDQRVKLAEDEIMLVDDQSHTAYRLERERAASGAKYSNGELEFWEHGGEATLGKQGQNLYRQCTIAR
jgi:membrane-bound inhibitor of C-type lysozyme